MQRPKGLLFDWDNTLVDTWPAIHDALNVTLTAMGHPTWTFDETRARVRKSMRESFPPMFGDRWEEAGRIFYERFHAIHIDQLVECPGAGAMLRDLAGQALYLGVVSNKKGDTLRLEADHLGWSPLFGKMVGAFDADRDKPDPAPVTLALSAGDLQAGRDVWFVGDTEIDMECARNTGCIPVLIRPQAPGSGEFEAYPPELYFPTCEDLCRFIQTLVD